VRGDRGENYEKCQKHIKKSILLRLTEVEGVFFSG
jgi:hypothetical protein